MVNYLLLPLILTFVIACFALTKTDFMYTHSSAFILEIIVVE